MASSRANVRAIAAPSDTFYVGNMKGLVASHQQTFIDTYAKVAFCQAPRDRKTPITAADLVNDLRVVPFYDANLELRLCRVLS